MGIGALVLLAWVLALATMTYLAMQGFRSGDRPCDVLVTAELSHAGQPDESRPVVVTEVRNPSASPVLVGLAARPARIPGWVRGGSITVPLRTTRGSLRPGKYETVGIVRAGEAVQFPVPVAAAGQRYRLKAAVGQASGRLRVHRLPVEARERPRPWSPDPHGRRTSGSAS